MKIDPQTFLTAMKFLGEEYHTPNEYESLANGSFLELSNSIRIGKNYPRDYHVKQEQNPQS